MSQMSFPGLIQLGHPKLPHFRNQRAYSHGIRTSILNPFTILGGSVFYNQTKYVGCKSTVSVTATHQPLSSHDRLPPEPFWLSLLKDFIWSLRTLFSFLAEQPGQLKHVEWPSFKSTLKTATLSLVLVAVFIVALSSVDSALCYVLSLVLRKAT
ncbi:PREDICTED: uncharacterized protein LOC104807801 isoform X2 [Tarenaya hassleriana]|uniref:uncharacterized protein LOC104807801 isoform X2 n=1 Tax=Tarenaya hassleriana TaxID=28532 RepID=UPI00053C1D39|nr:PREDICTED: uncharacterized protein LOC104807801 isoform X2 [Tarenaya hassleriana]